ncbi:MAG: NAD-dependent epimerase/dehydratase family protein [Planctomycetaceae bacterium]|nr:NAD-dependent epimerase/dehydratase family protein [Planctomycetaceae bacterium]
MNREPRALERRTLLVGAGALAAAALTPSTSHGRSKASPAPSVHVAGRTKGTLLVLGGTGFLGPHVVASAQAAGLTPVLFHRGKTNADLFPELESLYGDRDPRVGEGLKPLEGTRRFDFVVDTSSYVPRITKASAELLADRVGAYALVSTVSVYPDLATKGIDEEAAVGRLEDPTVEEITNETYGPLKALCEEAAEAVLGERAFVVRPGLIVGPRDTSDRFTYWPARVQDGGEVLCPGELDDPVQFIDVRDLADFLIHGLLSGARGRFNAVGPNHGATMADLVYTCRGVTRSDARLTWVPAKDLETLGLRPWAELPVWAPADSPLGGINTISSAKAQAAGLTSRTVADTASATLEYWNSLPAERRAKPRAGMSREREAKALAAWRDS